MVTHRATFWRIIRKKDVEEFHPYAYIAACLNCMFWILYGLPVVHPDSTLVITINAVGLALELIYLSIFCLYDRQKRGRVIKYEYMFLFCSTYVSSDHLSNSCLFADSCWSRAFGWSDFRRSYCYHNFSGFSHAYIEVHVCGNFMWYLQHHHVCFSSHHLGMYPSPAPMPLIFIMSRQKITNSKVLEMLFL